MAAPKPDQLSSLAEELQNYDWEQFQERFIEEMDERSKSENILQKETADLLEVRLSTYLVRPPVDFSIFVFSCCDGIILTRMHYLLAGVYNLVSNPAFSGRGSSI